MIENQNGIFYGKYNYKNFENWNGCLLKGVCNWKRYIEKLINNISKNM